MTLLQRLRAGWGGNQSRQSVAIDYHSFDVLRYADELRGKLGLVDADADLVSDLAFAIEQGSRDTAHILLARLLGDNPGLLQAADLGRRRRR